MPFDAWFRRRWERRMDAELRFHVESLADEYVRRGLARDEAERRARSEFGPMDLAKDECRDGRLLALADQLRRDARGAVRTLVRSPGFALAAILTVGMGVGANTAMYQLADAVLLRDLPVENPRELAIVELSDLTRWKGRRTSGYPVLSNPLWEEFRDHQEAFAGALAWSNVDVRVDRKSGSRAARGLFVSGDFFQVLGVPPVLGRSFTAADDRPGCGLPGVVVSHGFWERELGGDPEVIGTAMRVNDRPIEVIGVAPPGFSGLEVGRAFDLAVPICSAETLGPEQGWLASRTLWWLTVMGRRAANRSLEQTNAQLGTMSTGLFAATVPRGFSAADASDYRSLMLRAVPGRAGVSALRARYGDPLLILFVTTGLVLLLACTNLAGLLLARGAARERELALRLAIGASRGRIVSQLMVESGLLAAAGSLAGLVLAVAFSRSIVRLLGAGLTLDLPLDLRLLAFIASVAVLITLVFGLVPAWRSSRVAGTEALKASVRSPTASAGSGGLRQTLVVVQVALSVVLVFGALVFAATLRNLLAVDAGFQPVGVDVARVDFSSLPLAPEGRPAFRRDLLDRIRTLPGVRSAAEVRHVPLGGTGSSLEVWPDGGDPGAKLPVRLNAVTDGYLAAMGIPLVAGRDFDARDSALAPKVAIVNRVLLRRLGLREDSIGTRFHAVLGWGSEAAPSATLVEIVGVVPDTKYFTLREDGLPIVFMPLTQIPDPRSFIDVVIRAGPSLDGEAATVRRAVMAAWPLVGVDVRGFEASILDSLVRERLMATLSMFFGVLAVLIAAVGLYGLLSYQVARRTNEVGVRLALGATRGDIALMVLRGTARMVVTGLLVGMALAFAAGGAAESLVFGLDSRAVWPVALACLVLIVVAAAASYVPARRASRLEPLVALRDE